MGPVEVSFPVIHPEAGSLWAAAREGDESARKAFKELALLQLQAIHDGAKAVGAALAPIDDARTLREGVDALKTVAEAQGALEAVDARLRSQLAAFTAIR